METVIKKSQLKIKKTTRNDGNFYSFEDLKELYNFDKLK